MLTIQVPLINVRDYGAVGDGSTDDSPAIQAAIDAAEAGSALVFEKKVYKLNTGLFFAKSIGIEGNGATLLLNPAGTPPQNVHLFFTSTWGSPLATWAQTISADTNSLSVAISTGSLAAGDTIYLELGQDPNDAGEQHFVTICKVLSNDGSTVTIDVSIPYDIHQPSPPGAFTHKISKVTSLVENISVRNLNFDWTGASVPDASIYFVSCRNAIAENLSGRFTILVQVADSQNITVRNVKGTSVYVSPDTSSGRWLSSWQSENIVAENVDVQGDHDRPGFFAESWCRHFDLRRITLDITSTTDGIAVFDVTGGSYDIYADEVVVRNKGSILLFASGTQAGDIRFGYVEILGECKDLPLFLIERLKWKGQLFQNPTLMSKTVGLQSSWSDFSVWFATGLVRRLWVYVTDKTGITSLYIQNSGGAGPDVSGSLVNGTWVELPSFERGGTNSPFNSSTNLDKRLAFTTSTVTAGARLTVVAEVFQLPNTFAGLGELATTTVLPNAHAATHKSLGSDPIKLDELAAPTDVTTLNATNAAHGLLPKLANDTSKYFRGDGTWVTPPNATGSAAGFMSAADKTKLDNAAETITPSTLALRTAESDLWAHDFIASGGFSGDGSSLTNLNATSITSGIFTYGIFSITNVNSTSVLMSLKCFSGQTSHLVEWIDSANSVQSYVSKDGYLGGNGSLLTNINASNISSGTLNNSYTNSASTATANKLALRDSNGDCAFHAVTGDGSGLTSLSASNISSGTLNNARTDSASTATENKLALRDSNGDCAFHAVTGAGSGLTSLNASNISSGTIADARLSSAVQNGAVPVGAVIAWLKSYSNTPSLPAGYVECNGQTLSDSGSVYNGQVIPNLNASGGGTKRFLRGSTTSGTTGGSDTYTPAGTNATPVGATVSVSTSGATSVNTPSHTHVFTGTQATVLPSYYEIVWTMRIK
jgi:hypothetical protein